MNNTNGRLTDDADVLAAEIMIRSTGGRTISRVLRPRHEAGCWNLNPKATKPVACYCDVHPDDLPAEFSNYQE